jgi:hypothetical protein
MNNDALVRYPSKQRIELLWKYAVRHVRNRL